MKKQKKNRFGEKEDLELVSLLKQGDEEAFTAIYYRYSQVVYAISKKYLKDIDMANDALQNIFFKLWESRHDVNISVNLKNYIFTMTKNHIYNIIRHQNTVIEHNYLLLQSVNEHKDEEIHQNIERDEMMEAFHKAINQLPPQKREICQYKMEGKLSNGEIAKNMNLSVSSIKQHYSQSIKILRMQLKYFASLIIIYMFQ